MKIMINDYCGHPFQIELCRDLARRGNQVVLTYFVQNNTPKGFVSNHVDDSTNLKIMPLSIPMVFQKHSIFSRRKSDCLYGLATAQVVDKFCPDVVLSANMPLDAQAILQKKARQCNASFVYWMQDILSIAIEFVLNRRKIPLSFLAGKWYKKVESDLLAHSEAIVCIASEFLDVLSAWGIEMSRTSVIENWAPLNEIYPLHKPTKWQIEHNIEPSFCFMYSGTLGMKHTPRLLLELARKLGNDPATSLIVVAEGAGADWLRMHAEHEILPALRLFPFQPYERLSEVLASSDILISLLDEDCGSFAVPSKTLSYMCAGRPLLLAGPLQNLASKIVVRSRSGIAVQNSVEQFIDAATQMRQSLALLNFYGLSARHYANENFKINKICDQFESIFEQSLFNKRRSAL
jgi:glycosyltransferase involved in cell wall biosynthesis